VRAARLAAAVAARLGAGASVQVHEGASARGIGELLSAVAGACDAVVVLGGDGMAHLAAQALALGDTPLAFVPAGTGNDIADVLGLPSDPMRAADAVLAALDSGSVRRLDLGRTDTGRWWVTVLCGGFDSAVHRARQPAALAARTASLRHRHCRGNAAAAAAAVPATPRRPRAERRMPPW